MTWQGLTSPLPIFAVLFVFGIARAFFGPASASLVANLVPQEDVRQRRRLELVGLADSDDRRARWPAACSTASRPEAAYGVATLFMAGFRDCWSCRSPSRSSAVETDKPTLETLFAGFRYIWSEKVVLGAISLDLFAVLLSGAVALLPVYARDMLELGPWGLGLLRAAPGIGAIVVAIWLTGHPIRDHAGAIMLFFVALFGAFTVVFGLSTIPWLSIFALAMLGATDMVSVYVRETLIQLWTPDEVRGRVNAVNMVFVGASNELGEFRAGTMAALHRSRCRRWCSAGSARSRVAGLWALLFPAAQEDETPRRP